MELISFEDYLKKNLKDNLTVSIGDFDGVHKAHQILIKKVKELSLINHTLSAIITFDPHPIQILSGKDINLLSTIEEKKEIISKFDIDYLIVITFNKEFSSISKLDFINNYLLKINVSYCVEGADFRFGYLGSGKPEEIEPLSNNKIKCEIMDIVSIDNNKISSSIIRSYLESGNIRKANELLNYPYSFKGIVGVGNRIGRTLNFPTANLTPYKDVKLKEGVYAAYVYFDESKYKGMLNFGHNPSFNFHDNLIIEIHILNYNGNLYEHELRVEIIDFIRDEIKFNSKDDFINQLNKDKAKIENLLM